MQLVLGVVDERMLLPSRYWFIPSVKPCRLVYYLLPIVSLFVFLLRLLTDPLIVLGLLTPLVLLVLALVHILTVYARAALIKDQWRWKQMRRCCRLKELEATLSYRELHQVFKRSSASSAINGITGSFDSKSVVSDNSRENLSSIRSYVVERLTVLIFWMPDVVPTVFLLGIQVEADRRILFQLRQQGLTVHENSTEILFRCSGAPGVVLVASAVALISTPAFAACLRSRWSMLSLVNRIFALIGVTILMNEVRLLDYF